MITPLIADKISYVFNLSLTHGSFPQIWKFANIIPIYKKNDPQEKSNYRPISLLPALSKVLEKIVYKHLYNHLISSNLLYRFQSGFVKGDSTVCQLAHFTQTILNALESGYDVRTVFLDFSRAFDRVWHSGLIFKLQCNGVEGPIINWISSYLSKRSQRVVIDGQSSSWLNTNAGVPQGSILGPLFFLIYINDIVNDLVSQPYLFADDSSLLEIVKNPFDSAAILNSDLSKIHSWACQWLMELNPQKTEEMCISVKRHPIVHPPLYLDNCVIQTVITHKHIGVILSSNMSWDAHVNHIVSKVSKSVDLFSGLKFRLPRNVLETLYKSYIRPCLEYADVIWHGTTSEQSNLIERIQYHCSIVVTGAIRGSSYLLCRQELGWETLSDRRHVHRLCLFFKIVNGLTRDYLLDFVPPAISSECTYDLRNKLNLRSTNLSTNRSLKSFYPYCISHWNNLDPSTRSLNFSQFKTFIFKQFRPAKCKYLSHGPRYPCLLLTRLRIGTCSLNSSLFSRGLRNSPACSCGCRSETVAHYLLHCPNYTNQRLLLLGKLSRLLGQSLNLFTHSENMHISLLLNGSPSFSHSLNSKILILTQNFITISKRFIS